MAGTGLAHYFAAKYNNNGGTVTYSDGLEFAQAVSVKTSLESVEPNILYANNGEREHAPARFKGGTMEVVPDDMSPEALALALGITPETLTESDGKLLEYCESMNPPMLGFGMVDYGQRGDVPYFVGRILPKIRFQAPDFEAVTQGEEIEWRTPTLKADIFRDDTVQHRWKREAFFADELAAIAWTKKELNIADVPAPTKAVEK